MFLLTTDFWLGAGMVVAVSVFHTVALVALARLLSTVGRVLEHLPATRIIVMMLIAILGVLFVHTAEVWAWAGLFIHLGEFDSLKRALYFSGVTATTLGYGDVILSLRWQFLSTFEAMSGLILFGVTTAFLIALLQRLIGRELMRDR